MLSHSVMSNSLQPPWTAVCQAPLFMGILQARMLEWVAMPSSRGSSQSRDQTQVSIAEDEGWAVEQKQAHQQPVPHPRNAKNLTTHLLVQNLKKTL